jgi:ribonuclease P protein component
LWVTGHAVAEGDGRASQDFPRGRRLRKRRDFLEVQGRGRRVSGKHFLFFVRRREDLETSIVAATARFGITVTRKVGNAVTRNRIKRVVREGCRKSAFHFPANVDVVIVARPSAASAGSQEAAAELTSLARRLGSGTSA